jgi:hypothetical protein
MMTISDLRSREECRRSSVQCPPPPATIFDGVASWTPRGHISSPDTATALVRRPGKGEGRGRPEFDTR